jgi:hypothetical protein
VHYHIVHTDCPSCICNGTSCMPMCGTIHNRNYGLNHTLMCCLLSLLHVRLQEVKRLGSPMMIFGGAALANQTSEL